MTAKVLLFWVLFIGCFTFGYGQTFDIKKLSTNEGLPSGQIGDVVQDQKGFIWLSTYDGLICYNGTQTKAFTTNEGLRNNLIYDLFIDSKDTFWVSVQQGGVGTFDGDSIRYSPEFSVLDTLTVLNITESHDGRIWFSTYGQGVFIWDGNEFERLTKEDGLPSNYTWNLFHEEDGKVWIGTWAGIGLYDGRKIQNIDQEDGLSGAAVYNLAKDTQGNIWASSSNGISIFDGEKWRRIYEINGNKLGYVYFVFVDSRGLVWIATEKDGIYWYDGESYTHIDKSNGLSSNYIYSFHEDNEGRVWVATDENGVNIFRSKAFRIFSEERYISGESANVFFNNKGELWIGTDNGITKFEESGNSKHFELPDHLVDYEEVWDIDRLPNGNLLIQNSYSRLLEFDGQNFTDYGKEINLPDFALQDILIQDEILWMATESGLVQYSGGNFKTYTTEAGLRDNFVWSLYEDLYKNIWAVSDLGVSRVTGDSLISYTFTDGIGGTSMHLIAQFENGHYWIGTNDGFSELVINDEFEVERVRSFTLESEFLKETQFLQFDDEGNLWQGTSGGIHFFDKQKLAEAESGVISGLFFPLQDFGKGVEMNYLSSLKGDNGELWFGSYTHGVIKYEGEPPEYKNPPKAFLKSMVVNGNLVELGEGSHATLSHTENHLKFNFGSIFYEDPNRVFYQYRLKGFEEDWTQTYNKTEIDYTNLPPGDYEFVLKAKSIQSEWGQPVTLASFEITRPFWQTGWFYVLVILAVVGVIFAIINILLFYFEKKKLDELVEVKTEELQLALEEKEVLIKEIHHRVKNNMAVISGLLDLQGWRMKDGEAKSAIENSKLRIQTMSSIHEKLYQNKDLAKINFKSFVEELVEKVSGSLKAEDKEVSVDLDIEDGEINVNSAIPCGLILNEALCNCYEHAFKEINKGSIEVSFKSNRDKSSYILQIKDDGVGMPREIFETKLETLGLTLIKSLTIQIKGQVEFLNNNGTTVKIKIPR